MSAVIERFQKPNVRPNTSHQLHHTETEALATSELCIFFNIAKANYIRLAYSLCMGIR